MNGKSLTNPGPSIRSALTWVDHDSAAGDRSQRILRLFSERETRDELGIGAVRDSISDLLFPGTSTIHTRLRYMLFIPWIYLQLEEKGVGSARAAERARAMEIALIDSLSQSAAGEQGIIGIEARKTLSTLPSAIYWAGLGAWHLRLFPGTRGHYHRALDQIYRRRRRLHHRRKSTLEEGDDVGGLWDLTAQTWHPGIPRPPVGFPDRVDLRLTREEALFLQERVKQAHPESLLAQLAMQSKPTTVDAPWLHPDWAQLDEQHRRLLQHAHNFSLMVHGAALAYNLLLAELRDDEALIEEHRQSAGDWMARVKARLDELRAWASDLAAFWTATEHPGHKVSSRTMGFVERWIELTLIERDSVFDNTKARALVQQREIEKKRSNSRFTNLRMLEQWSGRSSLEEITYRWRLVQSYINDIERALGNT